MDMQVANRMDEAASGMYQAADRMFIVIQMQAEIQGMIAENKQREIEGKSMAYVEADFQAVKESYQKAMG
jgi:hypothetical protein